MQESVQQNMSTLCLYICSMHSRNLRNLKIALCILRIRKLHANLEIVQPILRLCNTFARSWNCTELTNGRELRALWDGDTLNGSTPQVWDLSVPIPRPRRRELLTVGKLPRSPWCGGLEYMPVTTEMQELCRYAPHWCHTISRLCNQLVHNVEIGMNFPDSENAQCNLKIVFLDCAEHIYWCTCLRAVRLYLPNHCILYAGLWNVYQYS